MKGYVYMHVGVTILFCDTEIGQVYHAGESLVPVKMLAGFISSI